MNDVIKNCGQCPNWEWFLDENGIGMGRCTKLHIDEVPETRCSCEYAHDRSAEEIIAEWFIMKRYLVSFMKQGELFETVVRANSSDEARGFIFQA